MSYKKCDRKFVLSDSTVNVYGYRLLTSGFQLAAYAANPIGYYMHQREHGVLVKWEDLTIEGDQITGYPVINLSNERGQQLADEVMNGFVNAASVGHIVVLEYSTDEALMLAGQTGPTITKWYCRETSLVDVPGNGNALARLYDASDVVIDLADLPNLSHIPNTTLKNRDIMKEVKLPITAGLLKALSLAADSTPSADEVTIAVDALSASVAKLTTEKTNLIAQVEDLKAEKTQLETAALSEKVAGMLDAALADKRITVAIKAKLQKDYAGNPEGLKDLLAAMQPHQSVTGTLLPKTDLGAASAETWDKLHKEGKLADLKAKEPEQYKQLFKAKYGTEPSL